MSDLFSMAPTSLAEILAVLAPGWHMAGAERVLVDNVCIDSRQAGEGSLFVALAGERTDGHNYVAAAVSGGARLALVSRPVEGLACVDTVSRHAPALAEQPLALRVADTLTALQGLARARRSALQGMQAIGITGSVGKTTVKEAVAAVLGARLQVLKSSGNHNNEIGLPLTLLTAKPLHQVAVLEMGMYQRGEIQTLCGIAHPDAGVVTNVRPVHLERLGSLEAIALAKAELVDALPSTGWVVLNGDDPLVRQMRHRTSARAVTYGRSEDAQVRLVDHLDRGLQGNRLTVQISADLAPGTITLDTAMLGPAAVPAALAGITVGLLMGLTGEEIQRGLLSLGQGLRLIARHRADGTVILDDCYNASPESVKAALALLRGLPGRRIAVLGDMLELGALELEGHRQVGQVAATACDRLVTVGRRARHIARAAAESGLAPNAIVETDDNAAVVAALAQWVEPGDTVLVKGSRSMGMEAIVAALLESVA
jgi:UDP-N-acetylmuramoyl-tripeptide--D-alanyl-D-alanine ligase